MSVKTRLLPCRCCQFSFFPVFSPQWSFWWLPEMPITSLILSLSLSIFWPIHLPPSRAPSLSSQILPLSSFLLFLTLRVNQRDYPALLWHPFFSAPKHKWLVYIQGSIPISEINKPDANVKMARCSTVSDVTAVERQQTVRGQFYACGTHNGALAKSNLISFTKILSVYVYRILLNWNKQSPIYTFADFFSGPLPVMNLLLDLPAYSHSQLVTYWHFLHHLLMHWVSLKRHFFNVQVNPLFQLFALCVKFTLNL